MEKPGFPKGNNQAFLKFYYCSIEKEGAFKEKIMYTLKSYNFIQPEKEIYL